MQFNSTILFLLNKLTFFIRSIFFLINYYNKIINKNEIKEKNKIIKKICLNNNTKLNSKEILFNPVFSHKEREYFYFLTFFLKIFDLNNLKPTIFSSYKCYDYFNSANFKMLPSLIFYSNLKSLKNFEKIKKKFYDLSDIIKFTYKDIECGKFALSSTFRITRRGTLDLNNPTEMEIFYKLLAKSILIADGSYNYIHKNKKIETGLFIDKGYVGEGELMQAISNSGKKIINFMNYYKNNLIIMKKMNPKETHKHPGEIDDVNWVKLKKNNLDKIKINNFLDEIKNNYKNNEWYPSAGTVVGKNFSQPDKIVEFLNFKNKSKKLAVVFNHIFWDASFFYGKDLFTHYQEWFYETYKIALKNSKINWLFKLHPSNKTKNLRDNVSYKVPPEIDYIRKNFGDFPEHIKIIDENFPFSSYNLYKVLNFCITVRGTTGLECAMLNKPVITAGSGKYSHKGFTYDFINPKDYLDCLLNLPTLPFREINYENARKYGYFALQKKPFNLKFIDVSYEKNINANLKTNLKVTNFEEFKNSDDIKDISLWLNSNNNDHF